MLNIYEIIFGIFLVFVLIYFLLKIKNEPNKSLSDIFKIMLLGLIIFSMILAILEAIIILFIENFVFAIVLFLIIILIFVYFIKRNIKIKKENKTKEIFEHLDREIHQYYKIKTQNEYEKTINGNEIHLKTYYNAINLFHNKKYEEAVMECKKASKLFFEYKVRMEELEEKRKEKQKQLEEKKKIEFINKQKKKGLEEYKGRWLKPSEIKKIKEVEVGLNNNFADLTPYQFEEFIATLFRKMGYSAFKTVNTGDFGADVIAEKDGKKVLIEVKKYSAGNNVTPKEVQRTLGALWKHKADKAVFVTTSDFSVRAKEIESEAPIELWDKMILHKMVRKYFIE